MSGGGPIPTGVLAEQLAEVIAGRRVRVGLFTTFNFDPGFFELQVLPALFDQPFSQVDKIRRIQLEDALGAVDHLAVYYDSSALAQEGEPARLDYRRIDVRRTTGCFHPKLVMLLVDEHPDGEVEEDEPPQRHQSLLVGILSANLTRAGWWENVECAHFEELKDRERNPARCPFRADLLSLLLQLERGTGRGEDQAALGAIREFIRTRTQTAGFENVSAGGRYYTRLFLGQQRKRFADWLGELRLGRNEWNLEILSPYFDPSGAGPLEDLLDVIAPRECRVFLPRDPDGTAAMPEATYRAISGLKARWSDLPSELVARGRTTDKLPPRRVHAKVYRLWANDRRDLLITGSVNLTRAGHSHAQAGNLEAAFLVDVTDNGYPRRWWLRPIDAEPERFAQRSAAEDEGCPRAPFDLSMRYDWGSETLAYRLTEKSAERFEICETSGLELFKIEQPVPGEWVACSAEAAAAVREVLASSSFLLVCHQAGRWRVLVREEHMAHRPSLLTQLTPEEILEYWALLTPAQRAAFIEIRLGRELELEGMQVARGEQLAARDTMFDRFAGIYHSFGCLRRHVEGAIDEGRERDAEARLLGAKYDSLPSLLEKSLGREGADPVTRYVTFLCARQLRDTIAKERGAFFEERRKRARHLDTLLGRLPDVRQAALPEAADSREFLEWFERAFFLDMSEEAVGG